MAAKLAAASLLGAAVAAARGARARAARLLVALGSPAAGFLGPDLWLARAPPSAPGACGASCRRCSTSCA